MQDNFRAGMLIGGPKGFRARVTHADPATGTMTWEPVSWWQWQVSRVRRLLRWRPWRLWLWVRCRWYDLVDKVSGDA